MYHGRPWTAMELAKIRQFQLQVNADRLSQFLDTETGEFSLSSIAVHERPWYIKVP